MQSESADDVRVDLKLGLGDIIPCDYCLKSSCDYCQCCLSLLAVINLQTEVYNDLNFKSKYIVVMLEV